MSDIALPTVVITRPLAQAGTLAQRVKEMGREAIVFPLLEIHALPDLAPLHAALAELTSFAMVAFVSPNAIDAVFATLATSTHWPRSVPLAIMGEGSRMALARHGVNRDSATIISPIDPERTDSQTLLQVLDLAGLCGKRVLIIRGESGRELLADTLRAAGVLVTQVAAYRRAAPVMNPNLSRQLEQLIDSKNDWIVTSSEALHVLQQMVNRLAGDVGVAKMQQQKIFVPHPRIAETARILGFHQITLTGSGDERLLAALQSPL